MLAILLIFTVLLRPLWPVTEYVLNYSYIVTNLCENKDRPQMKCDGKCYLAKMFAKDSEEEHKNPFAENRLMEICLFLYPNKTKSLKTSTENFNFKSRPADSYRDIHPFSLSSKIIQPPEIG